MRIPMVLKDLKGSLFGLQQMDFERFVQLKLLIQFFILLIIVEQHLKHLAVEANRLVDIGLYPSRVDHQDRKMEALNFFKGGIRHIIGPTQPEL